MIKSLSHELFVKINIGCWSWYSHWSTESDRQAHYLGQNTRSSCITVGSVILESLYFHCMSVGKGEAGGGGGASASPIFLSLFKK